MSEEENTSLIAKEPEFHVDRVRMLQLDLIPAIYAEGIPLTKESQKDVLGIKDYIPSLKFDYLNLNSKILIEPSLDVKQPLQRIVKSFKPKDYLTYMSTDKKGLVGQREILHGVFIDRLFSKRDKELKKEFTDTIKTSPAKPFLLIHGHGDPDMSSAETKNWRISGGSNFDLFEVVNLGTVFHEIDMKKYSAVLLLSCNPAHIELSNNEEGSIPVYYKEGNIPSKHPVNRVFINSEGLNIADPNVRMSTRL